MRAPSWTRSVSSYGCFGCSTCFPKSSSFVHVLEAFFLYGYAFIFLKVVEMYVFDAYSAISLSRDQLDTKIFLSMAVAEQANLEVGLSYKDCLRSVHCTPANTEHFVKVPSVDSTCTPVEKQCVALEIELAKNRNLA